MKKVMVALCALGLLAGCGPRELTPAEQRAQAHEKAVAKEKQIAQDRIDAKKAAVAKAQEAAQQREAAAAQHAKRAAVYRAQQMAKQPLPVGAVQVSSTQFLVDNAHLANGRYLCSGAVVNADNSKTGDLNDVNDIRRWDPAHVEYTCNFPVRKFRDAGFRP